MDNPLAGIGRRQHGLVTRAQALAVMSPAKLDRWLRTGRLESLRRGVVERAVDEALRRKIVRLEDLAATGERLDGRGRRRSTVIRDILLEMFVRAAAVAR